MKESGSLRDITYNKEKVNIKDELCWNVFVEDWNNKDIVYRNIFHFNWVVTNDIIKIYEEYKKDGMSFDDFSEKVRKAIMHEYWARSEYETIITSWPPYINGDELNRLVKERQDYIDKWGKEPYYHNCNLSVGFKIDVYAQIMLNWEHFINYLWENKELIKKLKKVR